MRWTRDEGRGLRLGSEGFCVYQALYRKYRPRRFSDDGEQIDVVGQEHITETLRRQLVNNRLSHAYLFVGTRGTGKTTCAKILARAVNCLTPDDGEPCNKCASCIGIEDGSILDVLEMDAASHNGVDDVRALRDEAIYTPATAKKRVYIIDEVHMLSAPAFNALLKILEEPPEHILFILATTELHKVPATILSRCQNFSFKRIPPTVIAKRLNKIAKKEGLALNADAAEKLSVLADGSMRNAISLLDQCASKETIDLSHVRDTLGLAGHQELLKLAGTIINNDIIKALNVVDALYNDGKDMAALLSDIAMLVRDILMFKLDSDSMLCSGSFEKQDLSVFAKAVQAERLIFWLDVAKDAIFSLSRSGVTKLAAEMCVIKMCDNRSRESVSVENVVVGETVVPQAVEEKAALARDVDEDFANLIMNEMAPAIEKHEEPVLAVKQVEERRVEVAKVETVEEEPAPVQRANTEEVFPWTAHLQSANSGGDDKEKLKKLDSLSTFGIEFKD